MCMCRGKTLTLGRLTSRTMEKLISIVYASQSVVFYYGGPSKLINTFTRKSAPKTIHRREKGWESDLLASSHLTVKVHSTGSECPYTVGLHHVTSG